MEQIRAELDILIIILVAGRERTETQTQLPATGTALHMAVSSDNQTFTSFGINYPFSPSSALPTPRTSINVGPGEN